jgi:predicted nuclease of predicted toxin-antitoxin system
MRFKLDENMPRAARDLLSAFGHDVSTAVEQGLAGHPDPEIIAVCKVEARALVTLDLDFADVTSYPPEEFSGIVVLRLTVQDVPSVLQSLRRFQAHLDEEPIERRLWIVEDARIRIRGGV